MAETPFIVPDWPAPPNVRALSTTRQGGVSHGIYASLNLGVYVGDDPRAVAENRRRVAAAAAAPVWLHQIHGSDVVDAATAAQETQADAAVTRSNATACVVMTADCLPVLFCDDAGSVVAAAHAGWRGLAGGVLENTVAAMQADAGQIMAWLGPAIGPHSFEVGEDVREAFLAHSPAAAAAFRPREQAGKYLADLYLLARQRLNAIGVIRTYGGGRCTLREADTFFSARRDGTRSGRQASLIWLG